MYVFCVGMYRACSTWQYDVVADLLERHRGGIRLGYMTGDEFAEHDDAPGDHDGTWAVLKSHEEHPRFRAALAEGRAVAVYSHRDPRDVVYSLMHKRRLSFDQLLVQGMIHQVLANDRFWTGRPHVLIQRYSRIIAAPSVCIEELAGHLGLSLDHGEAELVAARYSLESNRRRTAELGRRLREQGVDLENPSNAQHADRRTLLHWNHLRDGRDGGWREIATPRERVILAGICGTYLRLRGYDPDTVPPDVSGVGVAHPTLRDHWLQARGRLACRLRCASLRYPRVASRIKDLLGITPPPRPHAAGLSVNPDGSVRPAARGIGSNDPGGSRRSSAA